MAVIVFGSHKGGVGKSTLVASLSLVLCGEGKRVLAVDLDPQGSLSFLLSNPDSLPDRAHSSELVRGGSPSPFEVEEGLFLLWADSRLNSFDTRAANSDILKLRPALRRISQGRFDLVLLDSPTGIWRPLSLAALLGADFCVVPLDPSPLSVNGLLSFLEGMGEVEKRFGHSPNLAGVILNFAERKTILTERTESLLRRIFGERFLGSVPKTVRLRELGLFKKPTWQRDLEERLLSIANRLLRGVKDGEKGGL